MLRQRTRIAVLGLYVAGLFLANYAAFDQFPTLVGGRSLWFYTALISILLGNLLVAPYFVKPAEVISFGVAALVALGSVQQWPTWTANERLVFGIACGFSVFVILSGFAAILTKDSGNETTQRWHQAFRTVSEAFGHHRTTFTVVMFAAIFIFHRRSSREVMVIMLAWGIIVARPEIILAKAIGALRALHSGSTVANMWGVIAAYESPKLVLARQLGPEPLAFGSLLLIKDPHSSPKFAFAMDYVGRDEGLLLRAIEVPASPQTLNECRAAFESLPDNSVGTMAWPPGCLAALAEAGIDDQRARFVGFVAPETSLDRLRFEVVRNVDLQEGAIVEAIIAERSVAYQVIDGLTKEEVVFRKNTFGFVRAEARKVGIWNGPGGKFEHAKWLPEPNSPVLIKLEEAGDLPADAVGRLPGTRYFARISSVHDLVTHNTAILGILGVGKTKLGIELVERMLAEGIRVVCLDLTNQYAAQLAPFFRPEVLAQEIAVLNEIGARGRNNFQRNVEEGGSSNEFAAALTEQLRPFMNAAANGLFRVYNPSSFEVWRQDSRMFDNRASMATLTPTEVTRVFSDVILKIAQEQGETDRGRVCLVYEEAHSLIPEWNSAVAEGDRAATNGTARAILQGRKFGMGCLLISQRTANVTKTILNQCNTVFAMRTFDDTGREFLSNYIGKEYAQILPTIAERHAVFFGKASACDNPILIRLNDQATFRASFRQVHNPPAPP